MNEHDIVARFSTLYSRLRSFIVGAGLEDLAIINEDLLGSAINDYFEDIDRLKSYEGIDRINTSKIYAYEAYWILRRKPIQIKSETPTVEKWIYINELAVAMMLISKMAKEANVNLDSSNAEMIRFFDLLYYNLQYRDYNQKSLELMIEAFYFGCSCK